LSQITQAPSRFRASSLFRPSSLIRLPLAGLALLALLVGCGKSAQDNLTEARDQLASSAYSEALAAADAGLQAGPDEVTAWGLELVKLEAFARAGQGEEVEAQLTHLANAEDSHLTAAEYSSAAQQLQAAGEGPKAIEVLDAGSKSFPDDTTIATMLDDLKEAASSSDVDPAELEMLRSLGYIE
jgi:hypothetical protein